MTKLTNNLCVVSAKPSATQAQPTYTQIETQAADDKWNAWNRAHKVPIDLV